MSILISWAILTLSLWAASALLPGMKIEGGPLSALVISAIFGVLNFAVGWLLFMIVGFGTLGLGFLLAFVSRTLVSAFLLKITDGMSDRLEIRGFGTAILAALIMSGVGTLAEFLMHMIG